MKVPEEFIDTAYVAGWGKRVQHYYRHAEDREALTEVLETVLPMVRGWQMFAMLEEDDA